MTHDDPRLARIRKLLAQAEDPAATPAEAEAFTAKATQLIADYGIDRALLDAPGEPGRIGDVKVAVLAPYAAEKATLGATVAAAMRCRTVQLIRRGHDGTELELHVFGRRSDLSCVELLYTSLLLQGAAAVLSTPVPPWEHTAAFRRTWWLGFGSAIGERMRAAEEQSARAAEQRFAATGTSAAVVLADHAQEAEEALFAAYPDVRRSRPRRLTGGGMGDGWASGQRADLGLDPRLGRAPRGELG